MLPADPALAALTAALDAVRGLGIALEESVTSPMEDHIDASQMLRTAERNFIRLAEQHLPALLLALSTAHAENAALRENLEALQIAESHYRALHDMHGDGTALVGRAWDLLRRAGDAARALRSSAPAPETPDPKGEAV